MAEPLQVEGGLIAGVDGSAGRGRAYRGIPFAAPPVGNLRWKPPQPVIPWQGVRQADTYAPQCVQPERSPDSVYAEFTGVQPMSEDCLYLNVFTPAQTAGAKLPVMVWFHGGGFLQGSGANPTFVRGSLTGHGVVLVTFNYRVGPFGFFAHPELTAESPQRSSGNYGLLDMAAALRWVQHHIGVFGGDAGNVTIFGQSAGAAGVVDMMAAPQTRDLFAKAIAQSFGVTDMATLAQAEEAGAAFAQTLARNVAALRALSAQDLLQACLDHQARFWPIAEGWFMPEPVRDIFAAGGQRRVPFLSGWNADEGTTFGYAHSAASFRRRLAEQFGIRSAEAERLYPARDDAQARASSMALIGDTLLAQGAHAAARSHAASGAPTFVYHFVQPHPFGKGQTCCEIDPISELGAFHSAEYPYVLGTLDVLTRNWSDADRQLSLLMQRYWANFARTGNPNGDDLPAWPAFDPNADTVLELGTNPHLKSVPRLEQLDFIEQFGAEVP
jgi:para-nitrobenzyl esterase